ncbi:type VI secretion system tip protein VgrG [Cronobacter turicensis]|nr:type VI secretion system tip protein VgrG [Cronobacter turicensis]
MLNRITVQLPVEGLLFWKLSGREALSEPFMFTLTLLGTDARADRSALLGQPVTVTIPTQALMTPRYLNGKVTRVAVTAVELSGTRYAAYELTVEPDLWPMHRDRNLRIFQGQTVPQIVKTLLGESRVNMEERLSGSYRVWEYCVQYQESSLDFISRLLELEGITYHFRHEQDRHTLVLTDAPGQYEPFPGYETIPYHVTPSGGSTDEEGISQWALEDSVTPGIYSLDDYDFRKPNAWLFQARQNPLSPQPGSIDVYDWPGRFVEHGHGEFYARIRQERWQVEHRQTQGSGTALGIAPGHTFVLRNAPFFGDNGEYLTTVAHYRFEENRYASGPDSNTLHEIRFEVIPADVPYRPSQKTPWPRTYGPQTAKVVGPQGESIWTDKYGRVKVKFHWDRLGKGDDTSSGWVRVSSAWAGQGFGGVQIPRVGDEVVVDFINGDPDRPLITGRVYNEASMPPWALPAAATQMGFLSRSKDGSPDNANALRFEDKAGEEQVWLHAEKNMDTDIENDETHSVGSNRTKTIGANETTTVKKNRTETVVENETITVHQNRTETVDGNETITIHSNRNETVDQNEEVRIGQNQSVTVNGAQTLRVDKTKTETIGLASMLNVGLAQNTNIGAAYVLNVGAGWMTNVGAMQMHNVALKYSVNSGKDLSLSAGTTADFRAEDKITLVCGESMIVLEQNGTITLSANKIKMVGEKVIDIDGTEININ